MVDSFFVDPSKKKRKNRDNRTTSTIRSNQQKRQKIQQNNSNNNSNNNRKRNINSNKQINESDNSEEENIEDIDEEEVDSDVFADVGNDNEELEDINESDEEEEFKTESESEKRRRLAKKYLEDLKSSLNLENGNFEGDNYEFNAKDLDDEIISSRLKKDVAEQKGWVYKYYSKTINDLIKKKLTRVPNKCLTSVCISYPYLFTTSKDMEISKWDIKDPKKNPKIIKTIKGGDEFQELSKEHAENGHCNEIFTSAVSPDGKYLVTGGKDGRIIVWSVNSLSCIRVLETKNKKGEVLSLVFRRNSDQLYVACADLKIRIFSINQLAQLETLYGHQDLVVDITALGLERCVTVGSRDRTAMLWKIADETRLTFRGGDSNEKFNNNNNKKKNNNNEIIEKQEKIYFEGSIDCVSMIDDSHFVTGSDNGNISLWSLNKKKPLFTKRISHGIQPFSKFNNASAENNEVIAKEQISEPQPFWITSIYAIPYSDIFISGSWDGNIKIWKLDENLRNFELLKNIEVNGIVSKVTCYEDEENDQLRIYATLSKEHKFSRCLKSLPGSRNVLFTCIFNLKK
ncbi:pre-rRNA processing protein [Pichia californica]|uniref:Pre-rRNA processing protein n=1 Tax=Pichia californica TaxID=460514 RepID=A0A9P7BI08_9ASCO|nr:pre-rRNA processing protein [[Candida] californica]KAG0691295.1 pre-rRNA processing protein [[Candida] californica]